MAETAGTAASFTHLHVASGYSLRYGASTPADLVTRAAEQGMDALALTDRDGLYGAVKFVLACRDAGLSPLLGADLAVESSGATRGLPSWAEPAAAARRSATRRFPARGGAEVDPRHPRVTVLALGAAGGMADGAGWARLCRLVSATHLRGARDRPVADLDLVSRHARDPRTGRGSLAVLLGPHSEVGRAVLAHRMDLARAVLQRWQTELEPDCLAVEVVYHRGPRDSPASRGHAARLLALAREAGVPAVLSNAVRHAGPDGAATADVLDAARRLVALDARHLDRVTAEGYLKSPVQMTGLAREVARAVGDGGAATRLLSDTAALADRCRLNPRADLGVGSVHFPEAAVLGLDGAGAKADRIAGAMRALRDRCAAGVARRYPGASESERQMVLRRLADELATIEHLGYPAYFLTVAEVCDLVRAMGVRVAARGSGAGSLVNHLLGISHVDPLRHDLLMERFLSPLRAQLPDIDVDVESARRTEVYEAILNRFGADRVTCVSMMDTYRVRHAVRDVGAALGLPPAEIDSIAKSFPHIRARDARHAIAALPELRASGLGERRLALLFDLVERLDGLPRHVALHPCGVILSDAALLDRTSVEASWQGFPMSQFDKDDVEQIGLLKLDVLGVRMQSAMAYAVQEVARVEHRVVDLDDQSCVRLDDEATFRLIRSAHTLGCFQIESPGQRELVGKFAPETFDDLIIDISLFRPGPVKSDMVTPFLRARQGWEQVRYLHPRLAPALAETYGVVVFHEQVLRIVAASTGCTLAEADEVRRAMGSPDGQVEVGRWFRPAALSHGFAPEDVDRIWAVLTAFASFGFCKAHAAAFAVPTYQSAWLKAHHPAAFLAGVLTHDPGMYPKRLILDDARNLGIAVLGLDVNASDDVYRVEHVLPWDEPPPLVMGQGPDDPARQAPPPDLPDGRAYGIRLSLADVKGISEAEVARIIAGRPYRTLADFWHRARVSRPVVERLLVAGAFDSIYGLGGGAASAAGLRRRGVVTRRDLLLQVYELDRWSRSVARQAGRPHPDVAAAGESPDTVLAAAGSGRQVRVAAARQSQAPRASVPAAALPVQLSLDLGDAPDETLASGLPEMTGSERVRAELEVLGLDASGHVVEFYAPLLEALGVTRCRDLLRRRNRAELFVAGVKVATQTPPVRSGRRVIFLTLDDATGPVDATFFEDVQGPYAATVFHSWLLMVRGVLRRTGPRGVSLRATGAWELSTLWDVWQSGGRDAVLEMVNTPAAPGGYTAGAVAGAAASRTTRPVMAGPPLTTADDAPDERAGGMGGGPRHRRVLVHASGFRQSPYADVKPPGQDSRDVRRMIEDPGRRRGEPPRKLWHASPGSSGG